MRVVLAVLRVASVYALFFVFNAMLVSETFGMTPGY